MAGVASIGILAILSYGVLEARQRSEAMEAVPSSASPSAADTQSPELAASVTALRQAHARLDLQAMKRAEGELARQLASSPRARDGGIALAESLADRALVAHILDELEAPGEHVKSRAAALAQARTRLETIPTRDVARNLLEDRLDLAEGADLIEQHPAILLPDFPDPELQSIALARDLWMKDDLSVADAASIAEALVEHEEPSGLIRGLQALAHLRADAVDRGRELALMILEDSPEHPLAGEVLRRAGDDTSTLLAAAGNAVPSSAPAPTPPTQETVESPPDGSGRGTTATGSSKEASSSDSSAAAGSASRSRSRSRSKPRATTPQPKPSFDALVDEGCSKARSGDPDEALELLLTAFDIQPASTRVTLCMAKAHHRAGREASARSLTERVLRRSPTHRQARLLAAELEDARGNVAAAIAHYQKVLDGDPDHAAAVAYLERHGAR